MVTTEIYANTLAKQNEGRLLGTEKLRRIADSDDIGSAVKMLVDYGYGDSKAIENSFDADGVIRAETERLISFIEEECPNENLTAVLLARFVYNNAKARYKFKVGAKRDLKALYAVGRDYSVGIDNADYGVMPEPMRAAAEKLDAMSLAAPVTSAQIDSAFTVAMFEDMTAAAKKCGKSVKKYVAAKIDFTNFTAAFRLMRFKIKPESDMFVSGGAVKTEDIIYAADSGMENFAENFADTVYFDALKKVSSVGFDALPAFESDAEREAVSYFGSDLENMTGDAPLLHYYAAALDEYKTVKTVLTCIRGNAKSEIAKRVRWSD